MTLQVVLKKRSGNVLTELSMGQEATGRDLALALSKQFPKLTPDRSLFHLADASKKKLTPTDKLSDFISTTTTTGGGGGSKAKGSAGGKLEVVVKDLGPQISWKTVFLIEYAGPMLIHPLFYILMGPSQKSLVQFVVMAMITLHFLKRELETLFVHRFSHATMPFMNVFKNSFHYWALSGAWIAWDVYSSTEFAQDQMTPWKWSLVLIWLFAELSNLSTHVTLRNLRPPGTTIRRIPNGYGFSGPWPLALTSPNYFFETVGWLAQTILCWRSLGSWVFLVVATGQMYLWAVKKHKAYKKEFDGQYPKNRRPMFPFL